MRRLLICLLCAASLVAPLAGSASALTGKQPLVVVLCKFTDQQDEPRNVQYFQDLFSETGAGEDNVFDFWRDVSYGNLDLTGTVVKGWYTAKTTAGEFNNLPRDQQINVCAKEAVNDVDFNKFAGVAVVVNHKDLNGPLFGGGPATVIDGKTYNSLGRFATEWDQAYNGILHESLHALGLNHSRAITNPSNNTDYNDLYDIGSCFSCIGTPDKVFRDQGSDLPPGGQPPRGGPGLNAVQLLTSNWLAGNRVLALSSPSCAQQTVQLAALNHPEAAGYLAVRVPAAVPIFAGAPAPPATTGDYYTVELRDKSGWDEGIVQNGVLVHVHGQDGYSYWIDADGAWGAYSGPVACEFQFGKCAMLIPGGRYVDAAKQNFYVAVNSVDKDAHTAVVTIGSRDPNAQGDCKLDASIAYSGATTGDFNDVVTLAADVVAAGSTAPVPDATVSFKIGTQGCTAVTDAAGHARCSVLLNQHPGGYNVTAGFAGDEAYDATTASAAFTITQEESQVTYGGQLTSDYHDAFTASAKLVDPVDAVPISGKTVLFTLGAGDTCSAVTDSLGAASCQIVPTQAAGTYSITASFAGDIDYEASSDTKSFVITREQTTTAYTGPQVILQGQPVTLAGQLLEDGVTPIQGRTLTLRLGSQSCTGVTNASGDASCTLVVAVALGPQTLGAEFAGDAFYLPSSATPKQAIVFAFPARGAFVLGNQTVTAATPSTDLTWWSHSWAGENTLSGGAAVPAFKGFASSLSSNPPRCGGTWSTPPGNSPPPVGSVPTYMGVLVAGAVTKSGSTFSGNTVKIVVVLTQGGYGPNPGSPGLGAIVATYCQ